MNPARPAVTVVGAGLAGCEAALQLARLGHQVRLVEMRPLRTTPVHEGESLAQIVCSNSLKSTVPSTAGGLLKTELDLLGCRLLEAARETAVPAGAALAVDREAFSARVESMVASEERITLDREEITELPQIPDHLWLLATGPMTGEELIRSLGEVTGQPSLHFFDAIAPTVTLESLDLDILYRAARYGKGEADYLNAALDRGQYDGLYTALMEAEKIPVKDFDRSDLFEGCQPIEEIAASGPRSMAFGPLRPVGLAPDRDGPRPHAVVQLRQENQSGTLYGLVGFQTRLKFPEQKRVFRQIPGLENAEIVRYGQMHRNFYLDTPRCCWRDFSLKERPDIFLAGQMTGVEGYVESIASGLLTAWSAAARLQGCETGPLPATTMVGGLFGGFLFDTTGDRFSPMNANFGLLPPLAERIRAKKDRKEAIARRAESALEDWLDTDAARGLLAGLQG